MSPVFLQRDYTMRLRPLLFAAAAAATLAAGGCATNPVTGKSDVVTMSVAQEVELGRKMHPQILQEYGRYEDEALQAYVSQLGQRIAAQSHRPDLQYTFTVLDSEEVNAFALPGYVYITRGIMAYLNSEAELAAVLGHEVGHITARHSVRKQAGSTATGVGATLIGIVTGSGDLAGLANMAGTALVLGYGRDMELEADQLGAEYLHRLGYSPEAMIDVVRLLKNQEMLELQLARQEGREPRVYHGVFSSHPDNDTRLKEVVAAAGKTPGAGDQRPDGRDAYLQRIAGLPLGPSREQGVVKGSRFYHGTLGMTVAFPTGWIVDNQPTKVVASTPQQDAVLQLTAIPPPPGAKPQELLARSFGGTPLSGGESLTVNGLQGYTAVARDIGLPWGNRGPARGAVIYYNGLAYMFTGASRLTGAFAANDALFLSSIKTFRRLRDNELQLAEPQRIKLVKATASTRIAALAAASPIEKYPAERLRLLNDLYPDKEPRPGSWLKVVE
jgi:predicted Zn-dependent protease